MGSIPFQQHIRSQKIGQQSGSFFHDLADGICLGMAFVDEPDQTVTEKSGSFFGGIFELEFLFDPLFCRVAFDCFQHIIVERKCQIRTFTGDRLTEKGIFRIIKLDDGIKHIAVILYEIMFRVISA